MQNMQQTGIDSRTKDDLISETREIMSFGKWQEHSIKSYLSYIVPFIDYCTDQLGIHPSQADEKIARDFINKIQDDRDLSDSTVNGIISKLAWFYEGPLHLPWNSVLVPFRKVRGYMPYVPSPEVVEKFLDGWTDLRAKSFVCLVYGSGPRTSEVCRLQFQNVQKSNMMLYISSLAKNGEDRLIQLPRTTLDMLTQYLLEQPENIRATYSFESYLYPCRANLTRHICGADINSAIHLREEELGWEHKLNVYSFRRAFATHNYMSKNLTLEELMLALGHKFPTTTKRYLRPGLMQLQPLHENAMDSMEIH